jgi:hypothetical protein
LGEPFSSAFFWGAVIPVVLLHIWAIPYIADPFKYEKSYYLFLGVYGIVNTYIYFLVIQKFLYVNIGIDSKMPFIAGLVLLIALLVSFLNFQCENAVLQYICKAAEERQ